MFSCRSATIEELANAKASTQQVDYYSILGLKFNFWSNESQISGLFRHMYRQFLLHRPEAVDNKFFLFSRNNQTPTLVINDQVHPLQQSPLLPGKVHMLVFNTLIRQLEDYFLFHGAAAAREDEGIIIAGRSGAGKTSLVLKLVNEGYEFFSDEYAPIHRRNLKLYPFPRSLGLRRGTLELFPHLKTLPLRHNLEVAQGEKWLLDAAFFSPKKKPCSLKAIYFLDSKRRKGDYLVDMGLYREHLGFVAILNTLPGVSLLDEREKDGYPVYRFQLERKARCFVNFYSACQPFKEIVFYLEEAQEEEPDLSRKRSFIPMDKSAAALELLKHLQNRTRRSFLRREIPDMPQLLIEMGRIVEGVECWQVE
jgi:hypothetical protein